MSVDPAHPRGNARPALAALVCGATLLGLAPVFIRGSHLGPIATGFWRLALAAPVLGVWMSLHGGTASRRARPGRALRAMLMLSIPGFFFASDIAMWNWSVVLTRAANAALFVNFAPVLVTLVAWFWLGERFGPKFVLGMVLALCGAGVLLLLSRGEGQGRLLGDALAFGAAVFYAGYLLTVKRLREHYSVPAIMFWSAALSAVYMLAMARIAGEKCWGTDPAGWLHVLGLALVCHVAGQGLITYALAHLPASFSSVTLLIHPVSAAGFAWVLLGEGLGAARVGGGALVLVGIFLAGWAALRAPPRSRPSATVGRGPL